MSTSEPPDSSPSDKRRHHRAGLTLLVEYEGADEFLVDYTDNLSSGGTFVATARELAVGSAVRLALSFPGLVEPIAIDGVVRWGRAGEESGVGIEFTSDEGHKRLALLIERIRAGDPAVVTRVVRVLVVEDNPHVAAFIGEGLAGSSRRSSDVSFAVSTAANGQDALALLASERFDALIIDVYLPVIDGAHVIEQVRSRLGLHDLPVIAVSAGGEAARAVALAAGANIFIDKPMRLRQVIETMRTLLA
ncbi:MAG: TIGR02266 family protein [Myxococcales bacterium]|nr:TIGR02266 family protein [Myxococcales bacterium]